MKKMRRLAAILLAAVMVFAMGTTAFAQTVDNKTSHSYEAYQIFAGTQAADDTEGKLAVIGWGSGIDGANFLKALQDSEQFNDDFDSADTALAVAEVLGAHSNYADAFAALAHQYIKEDGKVEIAAGAKDAELPAGYYLLVDTTEVEGKNDAKNISLLQVTNKGDIEIQEKFDVPKVEKKVMDINDSANKKSDWQDSADYDIGDNVPFQLTGTVAKNMADYDTYFYQFNDTLSKGLTLDEGSVKVYVVSGDEKTEINADKYSVSAPAVQEDGSSTFTVSFTDLKVVAGVTVSSKIVVEYTATLNADANIGSAGNPNTVDLQFSNNPNAGGEGEKGQTPKDTVIVFTYKVVVNKVDQDQKSLKGAEFSLIKKTATGEKTITSVKNNEGTEFTFKGLDDGDYILRETETPAGYNTIADIEFTVTAEHEVLADLPQLTNLTGKVTTGEIEFTPAVDSGSLNTTVVNKSGATLPETGGIGTTIFYVVGTVLVIGAGILLVSKKRMNADNQ